MRESPYRGLPEAAFWKRAVTGRRPSELQDLYQKKFEIVAGDRIATAGSCFAQHISRELRLGGYNVLDLEPAAVTVPSDVAQSAGYGVYSCRYGNIYYVAQLRQLFREAMGLEKPELPVWVSGSRFYDAQRPAVEPSGLASPDEVLLHREHHLGRVREMIQTMSVMVFTLGLTEAWIHTSSGTVYPTAPGTVAGDFDPRAFSFRNFDYPQILSDFEDVIRLVDEINPGVRDLLTVSPVALAATATGGHVLPATIYSKSVLRAVAGRLSELYPHVAYFPSYEIITGQASGNAFYDASGREVTSEGVQTVMRHFSQHHPSLTRVLDPDEPADEAGIQCEEALLEGFAQ